MSNLTKEELEVKKLEKEIEKLEVETEYYKLLITVYYASLNNGMSSKEVLQ